ncbi:hypothetical protein ACLI4Z_09645 [Natrialbaceae archaeon A-arb3/5]
MVARTKAAARCTECDRAIAVWKEADEHVVPIGSVNGCPCGGTAFRLLEQTVSSK